MTLDVADISLPDDADRLLVGMRSDGVYVDVDVLDEAGDLLKQVTVAIGEGGS